MDERTFAAVMQLGERLTERACYAELEEARARRRGQDRLAECYMLGSMEDQRARDVLYQLLDLAGTPAQIRRFGDRMIEVAAMIKKGLPQLEANAHEGEEA